jgi:hypothetical protein
MMPKNPENIKLSILILSIPSRLEKYKILQDKLLQQIDNRKDVELLCMIDNKSMHIFEKRNELLRCARGSHLTFLDDDDDVSNHYIKSVTSAIEEDPTYDSIAFNQHSYLDGAHAKIFCKMGNPHEPVIGDGMGGLRDTLRPPYHWCVWRSEIAKSEEFRSNYHPITGQSCEDIDWCSRLYPKCENNHVIDDFLHIYRWSSSETESILK